MGLWDGNRLTENRLVAKGQEAATRWVGISRCKLSYKQWMNNKDLLHSRGNYIQYPIINHMEKDKNNNIC